MIMAKPKTKLPLGISLGKHEQKLFLKSKFPFLKSDFRALDKKEIKSEKVFKELFGDIDFVDGWLQAVYFYQN